MNKLIFKQYGFVHNFIIPGILLVAVIIGGIAMMSRGDVQNNDADRDGMSASVIVAQGVRLQEAIERARADGVILRHYRGDVDLKATLQQSPLMPEARFPRPPESAVRNNSSWQYAQGVYRVRDAQSSPAEIGSNAPDDVMYLPRLTAGVCARINFQLHGGNTRMSAGGRYDVGGGFDTGSRISGPQGRVTPPKDIALREGCVALNESADTFVYYKTIRAN